MLQLKQNRERYQCELSYIRALQQAEKNPIQAQTFVLVARFLDEVFQVVTSYPAIGPDGDSGLNVEWHLEKSICYTFYVGHVNVEIFDNLTANEVDIQLSGDTDTDVVTLKNCIESFTGVNGVIK